MFTRLLFWIFLVCPALASAKDMGTAEFKAKAMGGTVVINGEGGKVEGDLKLSGGMIGGGRFSVKLADLKTGMSLRDEHMLKALEADKFSTVHFTLDEQALNSGPLLGELTLHGVTRKVEGWVMDTSDNTVTVKGKIKLSDFGIKAPSYLKVTVADDVEIVVRLSI